MLLTGSGFRAKGCTASTGVCTSYGFRVGLGVGWAASTGACILMGSGFRA